MKRFAAILILLAAIGVLAVNYFFAPALADSASCSSGGCSCKCSGTECTCEAAGGKCSGRCDFNIGSSCGDDESVK